VLRKESSLWGSFCFIIRTAWIWACGVCSNMLALAPNEAGATPAGSTLKNPIQGWDFLVELDFLGGVYIHYMMNQTTKYIIWLVVIVVVVWGFYNVLNKKEVSGEPIKIGGAFALTGIASTWGEADRNGVTLAIEEINKAGGINGTPLELIVENTFGENTKTLTAVSKLVEIDKVIAIVGATWLDSYQSPVPFVEDKKLIMVTPSASITAIQNPRKYDFTFSTWYRSDQESEELASYLAKAGKNKVVFIGTVDPFWKDVIDHFKKRAQEVGVVVIEEFYVNPDQSDFRTLISRTKQISPDVVIVGFATESNWLGFLKQRQEIYPQSTLYSTESIEEFITKEGYEGLLANTYFIAPKALENDFPQRYKDRFNTDALFSASNAYDATKMILKAISVVGTDSEKIREYLKNNEFETVTFGTVRFDDFGGIGGGGFVIKKAKDGGAEIVEELK